MKVPRGIRNNNPGNIRISSSPWKGKIPREKNTDGAFEQFYTPEDGIRALMITLRSYIHKHKKDTIRKIINRWAPTCENDTAAYINTVSKRTGIGADEKIAFDKMTMFKLVEAICFVENGGSYISNEQIDKAWGML